MDAKRAASLRKGKRPDKTALPLSFGGINRIRFVGYNLSPDTSVGHPFVYFPAKVTKTLERRTAAVPFFYLFFAGCVYSSLNSCTFTPNDSRRMSRMERLLLVALLMRYSSQVLNS